MTDTTPIVDTNKGTTIDMISIFLAFGILLPPGEHNILDIYTYKSIITINCNR